MKHQHSPVLNAASTIFWIWGILLFLSGIAIGYPALIANGNVVPFVFMSVWGIVYCIGGFALRQRKWGIRWWATLLCIVSVVVLLFIPVKVSLIGIALNVVALVLVTMSWRTLGSIISLSAEE